MATARPLVDAGARQYARDWPLRGSGTGMERSGIDKGLLLGDMQ
jgi:hypothetical protein